MVLHHSRTMLFVAHPFFLFSFFSFGFNWKDKWERMGRGRKEGNSCPTDSTSSFFFFFFPGCLHWDFPIQLLFSMVIIKIQAQLFRSGWQRKDLFPVWESRLCFLIAGMHLVWKVSDVQRLQRWRSVKERWKPDLIHRLEKSMKWLSAILMGQISSCFHVWFVNDVIVQS